MTNSKDFQALIAEFLEKHFYKLLAELNALISDEMVLPTCYVSYCHESGIDHKVKLILECLSAVNIRWQCLIPSMKSVFIGKYIQQIDIADHIILIGNPALTTQHHEKDYEDAKILEFNANFVLSKDAKLPAIVCREIARIDQRHKQAASNDIFHFISLEETKQACFPKFLQDITATHLNTWPPYHAIFGLLNSLLPQLDQEINNLKQQFFRIEQQTQEWQQTPEIERQLHREIHCYSVYKAQQKQRMNDTAIEQLRHFVAEMAETNKAETLHEHEFNCNNNANIASNLIDNTIIDQAIKTHYQSLDKIPLLLYDCSLPIEQNYIDLVILENNDAHTEKNKTEKAKVTYLSSFEEIYAKHKEPIKLQDIFKEINKENGRNIIIEGRAGAGKSRLCQRIVNQWAKKKLFAEFTAILWIPLRKILAYSSKQLTLPQIVRNECLPQAFSTTVSDQQIETWLEQSAGKILWLLDGVDEVASIDSNSLAGQFKNFILQQSPRIITSRPNFYAASNTERRLEIIGFNHTNIFNYVENFFHQVGTKEQANMLQQLLQQNNSLRSMAHIPINLEFLCSCFAENNTALENISLTKIYYHIITTLLKRHLLRKNIDVSKFEPEACWDHPACQTLLKTISAIAWQGLQKYHLIIGPEDYLPILKKLEIADQKEWLHDIFCYFGLLQNANSGSTSAIKQAYYFAHLSFEEFMGAWYLKEGLKAPRASARYRQAEQFVRLKKYELRWQLVFSFTAGLLKDDPKNLANYWELLQGPPKDIIGLYHLCLEIRFLDEAEAPEPLTTQWMPKLIQWSEQYLVDNYNQDFKKHLTTYLTISQHITEHPQFMSHFTSHWLPTLTQRLNRKDNSRINYEIVATFCQIIPTISLPLLQLLLAQFKFDQYNIYETLKKICLSAPLHADIILSQISKILGEKTFTDNENQHTFIFSQQFYTELVLLCETAPQHYQTVANGLLEKLTFISIVESATADDHLNLILRTIKLLCKSTNQKINIPIEPIFHVIKKKARNLSDIDNDNILAILCHKIPNHTNYLIKYFTNWSKDNLTDAEAIDYCKIALHQLCQSSPHYTKNLIKQKIAKISQKLISTKMLSIDDRCQAYKALINLFLIVPEHSDIWIRINLELIKKEAQYRFHSKLKLLQSTPAISPYIMEEKSRSIIKLIFLHLDAIDRPILSAYNTLVTICETNPQPDPKLLKTFLQALENKNIVIQAIACAGAAASARFFSQHTDLVVDVILKKINASNDFLKIIYWRALSNLQKIPPHNIENIFSLVIDALQSNEENDLLYYVHKTIYNLYDSFTKNREILFTILCNKLPHHNMIIQCISLKILTKMCKEDSTYLENLIEILKKILENPQHKKFHKIMIFEFENICRTKKEYVEILINFLFKYIITDDTDTRTEILATLKKIYLTIPYSTPNLIDGITDLINGEKYEHKTIGFLMLELLIPEIMREQQAKTLALPLLNIPKEGSIDIELLVLKHLCTINTEVIDTILEQLFESIDSDISEIRYGYICEILAIKWQYDLNQIHLLLSKISRHNFSVPYTFCNKIGKITHLNQISESTAPITNLYSYFQNWLLSRTNLSSNQLFLIWLIVCKKLTNNEAVYALTAPNDFAIFYTHEDNELLSVKLPIEQGAIVFFIMQHICQQIPGFLRPNIDILENAYNAESTKALQQFKDFLNPTHPVHLDYITPPNFDALVTTEKPRLTLKSPTAASYPTIQSLANLSKSEPSSSYMEPSFSAT